MPDIHNFKSQFAEDQVLAGHFHNKQTGFCVEVGAHDGVQGSNTYYFEQIGWRCLLIEANPELAEACRKQRPGSQIINCAVVSPGAPNNLPFYIVEGCTQLSSLAVQASSLPDFLGQYPEVKEVTVKTSTLDSILERSGVNVIDFMTIDVEGHEWEALQGFSIGKWKPEILVIERNTHFPDKRIMEYLHANGYRFERTTGVNDWFIGTGKLPDLKYRACLWLKYYLPKYLTIYLLTAPILRGFRRLARKYVVSPARHLLKRLLSRLGWLDLAKRGLK